MNKVEYLIELIKRDVEQVKITEEYVQAMKLRLLVDLKRLEEKCEMYEEMYEDDNDLVMSAYIDNACKTTFNTTGRGCKGT